MFVYLVLELPAASAPPGSHSEQRLPTPAHANLHPQIPGLAAPVVGPLGCIPRPLPPEAVSPHCIWVWLLSSQVKDLKWASSSGCGWRERAENSIYQASALWSLYARDSGETERNEASVLPRPPDSASRCRQQSPDFIHLSCRLLIRQFHGSLGCLQPCLLHIFFTSA